MRRGGRYAGRGGFNGQRRGRGHGRGSSNSTALKGMFAEGIWHCNCTPRLPAEHFKVKKEGPNKGRWFYTCQMSEPNRCDFFLWEEDAKPREEAAVLSNSRNEPTRDKEKDTQAVQPAGKGSFARADRSASSDETPSPSPSRTLAKSSQKRTAREADFDDEDEFGGPLSGQDEADLTRAADSALFETPQKAIKTGVYATPATTGRRSPRKLPWLDAPLSPSAARKQLEPATPATGRKSVSDYFATPSKPSHQTPTKNHDSEKPSARVHFEEPETPQPPANLAAPGSPSPQSRYKDALQNPGDSASSLTSEVLAELAPLRIPPEKLATVRGLLTKHDLKTQGVIMGREISRRAIKDKEAKIVELEARIARLEAEKETDRGIIRHLKWKRDHGQEDEEGQF